MKPIRGTLRSRMLPILNEYLYPVRRKFFFRAKERKPEGKPPPINPIEKLEISKEIHFYRDLRNEFKDKTYIDINLPYGPPLAILLPWLSPDEKYLSRFLDIYGERGFDVITIRLNKDQFLYPDCRKGGKDVVKEFLDYLEDNHKYRPYIIHGFSVGCYLYGEMMAQTAEDYKKFSTIVANIKGCMWDSPVAFEEVAHVLSKTVHPKNFVSRWYMEKCIKEHFQKHQTDSIDLWLRAQNFFCNPTAKIPNIFLFSDFDALSNSKSLDRIMTHLENRGLPVYQKIWPESKHVQHFQLYPDDYVFGMQLFFDMCNLFPDHSGKYKSYDTNKILTSIRLKRTTGETIMPVR